MTPATTLPLRAPARDARVRKALSARRRVALDAVVSSYIRQLAERAAPRPRVPHTS